MGFASSRGRRAGVDSDVPHDGPEADPLEVAREIALRRLELRPHSRKELADQLRAKGVPSETADEILERFGEVGLVDDQKFAQMWATSRQANKLLSKNAVRRELLAKGVERDVIDEAVEPIDHDAEMCAARQLAERKWRSVRSLSREVAYRRMAGALARKGYAPQIITPVLRDVMSDDSVVDDAQWGL